MDGREEAAAVETDVLVFGGGDSGSATALLRNRPRKVRPAGSFS